MTTQIDGSTGVSKVQDGVVTNLDLAGGITPDKSASESKPLGVDQTWQDLTASRVKDVVYTNTEGRPIFVSVTVTTGPSNNAQMFVDSIEVASSYIPNTSGRHPLIAIVPPGSTYKLATQAGTITVSTWAELR